MEPVRRDQMIVVGWADEPHVGKTQAILALTIVQPPLDQLQKGSEVLVKMGKSSSARDKFDIGAAHSTDEGEGEVFVVEVQKPDWKEPLYKESKARLTMLEEI